MTELRRQITVYRAVTEGYDRDLGFGEPEEDFVYDLRKAPPEIKSGRDGTLWNREQKIINPPKHGLASVYIDGSLTPKAPLRNAVESWLSAADMALFKHPWRTCAYAEIDECERLKRITSEEAQKVRSHFQLAGFPRDFGLWACGMVVRRVHCNALQIFAAPVWWNLVQQVPRDQIWLPFVLWHLRRSTNRIHTIDKDIYHSKWFSFRRHGS